MRELLKRFAVAHHDTWPAGWHRAWVDGISERAAKGELRTSTDNVAKAVQHLGCTRCGCLELRCERHAS